MSQQMLHERNNSVNRSAFFSGQVIQMYLVCERVRGEVRKKEKAHAPSLLVVPVRHSKTSTWLPTPCAKSLLRGAAHSKRCQLHSSCYRIPSSWPTAAGRQTVKLQGEIRRAAAESSFLPPPSPHRPTPLQFKGLGG